VGEEDYGRFIGYLAQGLCYVVLAFPVVAYSCNPEAAVPVRDFAGCVVEDGDLQAGAFVRPVWDGEIGLLGAKARGFEPEGFGCEREQSCPDGGGREYGGAGE
jgi:hypothetical protein